MCTATTAENSSIACKVFQDTTRPDEAIQTVMRIILPQEKFLQFDWLRAVVFQPNLKYLHVKMTNLLRVVV